MIGSDYSLETILSTSIDKIGCVQHDCEECAAGGVPTPRTDALVQVIEGGREYAPLDKLLPHARTLERELAEANSRVEVQMKSRWECEDECFRLRRAHERNSGCFVPEGWKLVPLQATDAMQDAALDAERFRWLLALSWGVPVADEGDTYEARFPSFEANGAIKPWTNAVRIAIDSRMAEEKP